MAETGSLKSRLEKDEGAERRLERSGLLNVEGFLARRTPGFVILLGLLLLILIWTLDLVTGSFAVGEFYLVPIGVVAFSRGRWVGTLMTGVASLAWGAADVATHMTAIASSVTYWNFLTRFFIFEAVVLLVAPMRDVLVWERELAAKESATAAELRALIELRETLMHSGGSSPLTDAQREMDEAERVEESADLEA
jgi:K+-sensing histidine kinase KdpD